MISIHYKPLETLRPIHISILATAETQPSLVSIGQTLGMPMMMLEHAAEDLAAWQMLSRAGDQVRLLERGIRCISVWASTDKRGSWTIDNDDCWSLGKGVFSFRAPLTSLSDAGLDIETGKRLSVEDAHICLNDHKRAISSVEQALEEDAISSEILDAIARNVNVTNVLEASLDRARTRLHLNRICRQAETALEECRKTMTLEGRQLVKVRRDLHDLRVEAERKVLRQQRETERVIRVLLAFWLSQRQGFLGHVASLEPNALLIRSDQGDSEQIDKSPQPQEPPKGQQDQGGQASYHSAEPSFFNGVWSFLKSLLR